MAESRYCEDCKWFRRESGGAPDEAKCDHRKAAEERPLNGPTPVYRPVVVQMFADSMRQKLSLFGGCGAHGELWEPRDA